MSTENHLPKPQQTALESSREEATTMSDGEENDEP